MGSPILDTYFDWLIRRVDAPGLDGVPDAHSYRFLLRDLFRKEFYSIVPNDDSRHTDGWQLREVFGRENKKALDEMGDIHELLDCPVGVFEVLLAMGDRMAFMADGSSIESNPAQFFWEMVFNVGLGEYTDSKYFSLGGRNSVYEKLDRALERRFDEFGRGGFLGFSRPKTGIRNIELWYLMNYYIMEKLDEC